MIRRSIFDQDETARQLAFRSRAWLDGVEVTNRCQIAETDANGNGRVLLLKHDADGKPYLDAETHRIATEWKTGHVYIEPNDGGSD
jgi:hypothetical protein